MLFSGSTAKQRSSCASDTQLCVTVPSDAQSGVVTVTYANGEAVTSSQVFTISGAPGISGTTPQQGFGALRPIPGAANAPQTCSAADAEATPPTCQRVVTVAGVNFDGAVAENDHVSIGGIALTVEAAYGLSAQSLTAILPASAPQGALVVETPAGLAQAATPWSSPVGAPTVAAVAPLSAYASQAIVLKGTGFDATTAENNLVELTLTTASGAAVLDAVVTSATADTLTFIAPQFSAAALPAGTRASAALVVRTPNGSSAQPAHLVLVGPPTLSHAYVDNTRVNEFALAASFIGKDGLFVLTAGQHVDRAAVVATNAYVTEYTGQTCADPEPPAEKVSSVLVICGRNLDATNTLLEVGGAPATVISVSGGGLGNFCSSAEQAMTFTIDASVCTDTLQPCPVAVSTLAGVASADLHDTGDIVAAPAASIDHAWPSVVFADGIVHIYGRNFIDNPKTLAVVVGDGASEACGTVLFAHNATEVAARLPSAADGSPVYLKFQGQRLLVPVHYSAGRGQLSADAQNLTVLVADPHADATVPAWADYKRRSLTGAVLEPDGLHALVLVPDVVAAGACSGASSSTLTEVNLAGGAPRIVANAVCGPQTLGISASGAVIAAIATTPSNNQFPLTFYTAATGAVIRTVPLHITYAPDLPLPEPTFTHIVVTALRAVSETRWGFVMAATDAASASHRQANVMVVDQDGTVREMVTAFGSPADGGFASQYAAFVDWYWKDSSDFYLFSGGGYQTYTVGPSAVTPNSSTITNSGTVFGTNAAHFLTSHPSGSYPQLSLDSVGDSNPEQPLSLYGSFATTLSPTSLFIDAYSPVPAAGGVHGAVGLFDVPLSAWPAGVDAAFTSPRHMRAGWDIAAGPVVVSASHLPPTLLGVSTFRGTAFDRLMQWAKLGDETDGNSEAVHGDALITTLPSVAAIFIDLPGSGNVPAGAADALTYDGDGHLFVGSYDSVNGQSVLSRIARGASSAATIVANPTLAFLKGLSGNPIVASFASLKVAGDRLYVMAGACSNLPCSPSTNALYLSSMTLAGVADAGPTTSYFSNVSSMRSDLFVEPTTNELLGASPTGSVPSLFHAKYEAGTNRVKSELLAQSDVPLGFTSFDDRPGMVGSYVDRNVPTIERAVLNLDGSAPIMSHIAAPPLQRQQDWAGGTTFNLDTQHPYSLQVHTTLHGRALFEMWKRSPSANVQETMMLLSNTDFAAERPTAVFQGTNLEDVDGCKLPNEQRADQNPNHYAYGCLHIGQNDNWLFDDHVMMAPSGRRAYVFAIDLTIPSSDYCLYALDFDQGQIGLTSLDFCPKPQLGYSKNEISPYGDEIAAITQSGQVAILRVP